MIVRAWQIRKCAQAGTGGLEDLYAWLLTMEHTLLMAVKALEPDLFVHHFESILDEDRNEAFKLMALRVAVEGPV